MNRNHQTMGKLWVSLAAVVVAWGVLAGINGVLTALPNPGLMVGFVDDWSAHHIALTNPGTAPQALAEGRVTEWYRRVNNPRYIMQEMRRHPLARLGENTSDFSTRYALFHPPTDDFATPKKTPEPTLAKDWNVNIGPKGVGTGQFPAKFSFTGGVSVTDLAVFNTSEPGATAAATLMGLNDLYTTAPTVAFAFDTYTSDTVGLSVAFDLTGDQLAFISTNGGHAYFNVLRYQTGTGHGTAYATPSNITTDATTSGSTYRGCVTGSSTTVCLYRAEFGDGDTDTNSPPYYDYGTDTLWVGDNSGYIHEFTNVFNGDVAEKFRTGTTAWMYTGSSSTLTGPVYDESAYVYVGTSTGLVYGFNVSTGAINSSTNTADPLTHTGSLGLTDAPLLDLNTGSNSYLYFGIGEDDAGSDSAITRVQVPNISSGYYEVYFGGSSATVPVFSGVFDNTHYIATGSTADDTGYITTCNSYSPGYYFNPIHLSGFPTAANGRTRYNAISGDVYEEVMTAVDTCSPQTEILNGTHDYIYFSVSSHADHSPTGCTTGAADACVFGFIVGNATTYTWTAAAAPNLAMSVPENTTAGQSSTSGIIIDNTATGGGSNLYFSTNATTNGAPCTTTADGCAIQVTQSGL